MRLRFRVMFIFRGCWQCAIWRVSPRGADDVYLRLQLLVYFYEVYTSPRIALAGLFRATFLAKLGCGEWRPHFRNSPVMHNRRGCHALSMGVFRRERRTQTSAMPIINAAGASPSCA